MSELTLKIDGMHCGSCVRRVSQALSSVKNVEVEEVRVGAARVRCPGEPSMVAQAIAALEAAGFTAHLEP